jgi:ATP-dependent DNA helicase PIF1
MLNLSLYYLNEILSTYNKSLIDYIGIPKLPINYNPNDAILTDFDTNRYRRAEKEYDRTVLHQFVIAGLKMLNNEQLIIFNAIIYSHNYPEKIGQMYFVDGPGGTGKTFLYNLILAQKRSEGKIALAVSTSGISANLLEGGKTAHSVLRIPIPIFSDSTCDIETNTDLAEMLRECDCIIWDEAVMADKHIFMAVDRTLQDLMTREDPSLEKVPFGNKIMLFGGDFRQILPVVKNGNRSSIVNASIKKAKKLHSGKT